MPPQSKKPGKDYLFKRAHSANPNLDDHKRLINEDEFYFIQINNEENTASEYHATKKSTDPLKLFDKRLKQNKKQLSLQADSPWRFIAVE